MRTPHPHHFSSFGKGSGFLLLVLLLGGLFTLPVRSQTDAFDVPGLEDASDFTPSGASPAQGNLASDSVSADSGTSLFGLVAAGGWAMWVLGGLSVGLIGLSIYLGMEFRKRNFAPPELAARLTACMKSADLETALRATEEDTSVLAQSMNQGIHLIYDRGYEVLSTDSLSEVMSDASVKGNRHRAKLVNYFGTIAQAAPMVGLLGTVSGMIKAFGKLGQEGMGDPGGLAANISEALVTTATGLIIAIPAIFLYSYFRDNLQELITRTDEEAAGMIKDLKYALHRQTSQSSE